MHAFLTEEGGAPKYGQIQCNPDLGQTFRTLAEHGALEGASFKDKKVAYSSFSPSGYPCKPGWYKVVDMIAFRQSVVLLQVTVRL